MPTTIDDLSEEIHEIVKNTLGPDEFVKWFASRWTYLNGQSPRQWVERGGDPATVVEGAEAFVAGAYL